MSVSGWWGGIECTTRGTCTRYHPAVRVLHLRVDHWRGLRNVDLEIPEDTALVCLVGENGTGKSGILELLSASAYSLGISQGVETNRGNPFVEPHELFLSVKVPIAELHHTLTEMERVGVEWDGRIFLHSTNSSGQRVTADGIADPILAASIAATAVTEIRSRNETQHLFLDADRAYPPTQFQPQQLIEIWNQDYRAPEFTRKWSYRPTRTLYEEWLKYLVAVEERSGAQLIADTRTARANGDADPVFVDPFDGYRDLLGRTLPHLRFVGIETSGSQRTVVFNSAGLDLTFNRLSGGEREIAFLTGQVDRFRLQRGLLLVDEPELHLNPDLLRSWLSFLRDTINDGQVWFATHSLEAVEVAGPASTFVFEREPQTRLVVNPRPLTGRPVISALSAAIGSPAFSLARLRFVFLEGERQTRERERFYAVCGEPDVNRFLEGGGCQEVLRRLNTIKELAAETGEQLRVGGVIDRDFREDAEAAALEADCGVHVLRCHEIENVFLQPQSIQVLLERAGRGSESADDAIRTASDRHAGLWIVDRAAALHSDSVPKASIGALAGKNHDEVNANWSVLKAASSAPFDAGAPVWDAYLETARAEYERRRMENDWWRRCLGKQTLSGMPVLIGLSSAQVLEQHVVKLWESDVAVPEDVVALREYLNALTA